MMLFHRNLLQTMTSLLSQPSPGQLACVFLKQAYIGSTLLPDSGSLAVNIKVENMVPALKGNHYMTTSTKICWKAMDANSNGTRVMCCVTYRCRLM